MNAKYSYRLSSAAACDAPVVESMWRLFPAVPRSRRIAAGGCRNNPLGRATRVPLAASIQLYESRSLSATAAGGGRTTRRRRSRRSRQAWLERFSAAAMRRGAHLPAGCMRIHKSFYDNELLRLLALVPVFEAPAYNAVRWPALRTSATYTSKDASAPRQLIFAISTT